ncbi:IS3 family transposase, partial [Streptococcus equi]|uniref:IS3 family transposase n=1 Tax=Streptococcus equi TaxID=1336 RepID=UPI000AAA931B
ELEQANTEYYLYYNNKQIKTKLKGLSPFQYRTKSFQELFVQLFGGSTPWGVFLL